jgi:hypothetical protein
MIKVFRFNDLYYENFIYLSCRTGRLAVAADKEILNSLRGEAPPKAELLREFCFMMTLKDGKFYKDGNPYPLEFGNREQIDLIKKCQESKIHGVPAELHLGDDGKTFVACIGCVCGVKTEIGQYIIGSIRRCKGCKLTYEIFEDDDFGFTYVKILK